MTTQNPSLKITVLSGGPSAERDVSLQTGAAIIEALQQLGHRVEVIDPDHRLFDRLSETNPDLVFIALHGTYGEDGVIQGCLEWFGVPYTGSGVKSSAIAMDKALSRTLFESVQIPVAAGAVWRVGSALPTPQELPPKPWIVKPTNEGSSVGLDQCSTGAQLAQVLSNKETSGPREWLIESFIEGVEVSVVIFNHEIWGSVEIAPSQGIYDFDAKYVRGDTQYYCPPRLPSEVISRLEDYALRAYKVLECEGVCRVDFITDQSCDIVLELNTLPGMTSSSLVPKVAAARGVSFNGLIERMIAAALKDK